MTIRVKCGIIPNMKNFTIFFLTVWFLATPKVYAQNTELTPVNTETSIVYEQVNTPLTITDTGIAVQDKALTSINIKVEPKREKTLKEKAEELVTLTFGTGQFKSFDWIVQHESNWNPKAVNPTSGACGLGQALPCSKMTDKTPEGQLSWTVDYIANRYGTPNNAKAFWLSHHWY